MDKFDEWQSGRKAQKLRSRVRKGVPDCVRGKVWQMMMGSMVSHLPLCASLSWRVQDRV